MDFTSWRPIGEVEAKHHDHFLVGALFLVRIPLDQIPLSLQSIYLNLTNQLDDIHLPKVARRNLFGFSQLLEGYC